MLEGERKEEERRKEGVWKEEGENFEWRDQLRRKEEAFVLKTAN